MESTSIMTKRAADTLGAARARGPRACLLRVRSPKRAVGGGVRVALVCYDAVNGTRRRRGRARLEASGTSPRPRRHRRHAQRAASGSRGSPRRCSSAAASQSGTRRRQPPRDADWPDTRATPRSRGGWYGADRPAWRRTDPRRRGARGARPHGGPALAQAEADPRARRSARQHTTCPPLTRLGASRAWSSRQMKASGLSRQGVSCASPDFFC